ncbi:MAG: efflux RND transporter periplasmic adaptor subunit [Verrucomicrobiota bacterium]
MKRFFTVFARLLIGLGIIVGTAAFCFLLWKTRPVAEKKETKVNLPVVEFLPIKLESHQFTVASQGIIEADRRSQLAAEVGGAIIETSSAFNPGMAVAEGDLLVRIEPADYKAAKAQAESTLIETRSTLASEQARSEQARRDWVKMGRGGSPSDLVLRIPQLEAAQARVEAASAALAKAEKDLERTEIRAPYDAIIATTTTELGSFVAPGTPIAEIFATGPYEVRLPLSIDEAQFLEVKEGSPVGKVVLSASAATVSREWSARIIRGEGEVDRATRSVYVVAQIEGSSEGAPLSVRPGLFVKASITGRSLPDLAAVPFQAFLDLDRVVVIDPDNRLRFREVSVVHREGDTVYIDQGLKEGDRLAVTELSRMIEGILVEPRVLDTEAPKRPVVSSQ